MTGFVWHLDVGSSHPGTEGGPKGTAVRRSKVVRELGLERREAVWSLSTVAENVDYRLSLVREERNGNASCESVVGLH